MQTSRLIYRQKQPIRFVSYNTLFLWFNASPSLVAVPWFSGFYAILHEYSGFWRECWQWISLSTLEDKWRLNLKRLENYNIRFCHHWCWYYQDQKKAVCLTLNHMTSIPGASYCKSSRNDGQSPSGTGHICYKWLNMLNRQPKQSVLLSSSPF